MKAEAFSTNCFDERVKEVDLTIGAAKWTNSAKLTATAVKRNGLLISGALLVLRRTAIAKIPKPISNTIGADEELP
jgi:hypothetical protein